MTGQDMTGRTVTVTGHEYYNIMGQDMLDRTEQDTPEQDSTDQTGQDNAPCAKGGRWPPSFKYSQ